MLDKDLDTRMEQALRDEPLRPVPAGLFMRIQRHVRLLAMAQQERQAFRARATLAVACALALILAAGIQLWRTAPLDWAGRRFPGAWGYVDYLRLDWTNTNAGVTLALVAVMASIACAILVALAVPAIAARGRKS
ncbi:MAG TPA: hypothetical protein PLO62_03135 [Candidatus Hydrogenedentes bacterium]|nr:hypothetical protein [Candidatus Hydrogenedentota bacterium]HOS03013.1 hypothetical protein [Candidatus Hydrogenedentota bacterium]